MTHLRDLYIILATRVGNVRAYHKGLFLTMTLRAERNGAIMSPMFFFSSSTVGFSNPGGSTFREHRRITSSRNTIAPVKAECRYISKKCKYGAAH